MKKNDLAEIKKADLKTIQGGVKKVRQELTSLHLDLVTKKLTNLRAVKNKRRDLAQMLTILKQKQMLKELEDIKKSS